MKNLVIIMCFFTGILHSQQRVKISEDTLFRKKISIRAIQVDGEKVWYAGSENQFGYYDLETDQHVEKHIVIDTSKLEFRSIAMTGKAVFIANIGNPAYVVKIDKRTLSYKVVYEEYHDKVFYDSMQFSSDLIGFAIGDPTDDCLSVLKTTDGGNSWAKVDCDELPKTVDGEAAFAASNTNIEVRQKNVWLFSGGKKSRVFKSDNSGKTWQVYDTPIIQGHLMTGIFTADFYNDTIGFIAGGDYEKLSSNTGNKAITFDGGITWKLTAEHSAFGYASCIQFVPKSGGKKLLSVGASGVFLTADFGETWEQTSSDTTLYTVRFINQNTAVAAGKNKLIRFRLQ